MKCQDSSFAQWLKKKKRFKLCSFWFLKFSWMLWYYPCVVSPLMVYSNWFCLAGILAKVFLLELKYGYFGVSAFIFLLFGTCLHIFTSIDVVIYNVPTLFLSGFSNQTLLIYSRLNITMHLCLSKKYIHAYMAQLINWQSCS